MTTEPRLLINQVCAALDQRLEQLPPSTQKRLALARAAAVASRQPRARVTAPWSVAAFAFRSSETPAFSFAKLWHSGLTAALPLLIAAAGIVVVYQLEHQQHLQKVAELDVMMLTDDLPLSAYADRGFNVYLSNRGS